MKKFFMFLAVAGLMTFSAAIASAQDQAAPAAEEAEAMAAEKVIRPATAKNMKNFFIIVFVLLVIN